LSQILEDNPHPKYYLSARACKGILERAKRRGKALPEVLEKALRAQASLSSSEWESQGGKGLLIRDEQAGTLDTGNTQVICASFDARGNGDGKTVSTLATTNGGEPAVAFADVADPFAFAQNQRDELRDLGDVSGSLAAEPGMKQQTYVAEPVAYSIGNGQAAQAGLNEKCYALDTMHDAQAVFSSHILRRLTPLECTRLQGFPDGWVDIGDWEDTKGRLHKEADAPKYKALGNSIAIPFWEWMARRMVAVLKRDGVEHPTMCSLFDGIGGFPLSFERAGCEPVWASEIEEFPIAVTKRHFPEPEGAEEAKNNYQPKEAFDDCLDR
jgi:DNA (cytosine-5)-methyltransferase 1